MGPEGRQQRLGSVSPTSLYLTDAACLPQIALFAKMETLQDFGAKLFCSARSQHISRGRHQGQSYYEFRLPSITQGFFFL